MLKEVFKVRTRDESGHAQSYLAGLLSRCQRKNMERIGEDLPGIKYQDLQHFLSDSPWRGWHHHMALVGAAMVFALAERQRASRTSPLTSVRDVVEMVA